MVSTLSWAAIAARGELVQAAEQLVEPLEPVVEFVAELAAGFVKSDGPAEPVERAGQVELELDEYALVAPAVLRHAGPAALVALVAVGCDAE